MFICFLSAIHGTNLLKNRGLFWINVLLPKHFRAGIVTANVGRIRNTLGTTILVGMLSALSCFLSVTVSTPVVIPISTFYISTYSCFYKHSIPQQGFVASVREEVRRR